MSASVATVPRSTHPTRGRETRDAPCHVEYSTPRQSDGGHAPAFQHRQCRSNYLRPRHRGRRPGWRVRCVPSRDRTAKRDGMCFRSEPAGRWPDSLAAWPRPSKRFGGRGGCLPLRAQRDVRPLQRLLVCALRETSAEKNPTSTHKPKSLTFTHEHERLDRCCYPTRRVPHVASPCRSACIHR